MPPKRREIPAWSAALEKMSQDSVTSAAGVIPGSTDELPAGKVTDAPKRSLSVNRLRISAAAALNMLCPELCSAKGGVGNVAFWYGSQSSPSMRSVPWPGPPHASTFWPR